MSLYKDKAATFDAAFKQMVQDSDSDSDCPNRSQKVQEDGGDATATKQEPIELAKSVDDDLDDSIEFLGATSGVGDVVALEDPKIELLPEKSIEDASGVEEIVIEERNPEPAPEQLATGRCRRSQRLQKKSKKTPPKRLAGISQSHVIEISISDGEADGELTVLHESYSPKIARTPTIDRRSINTSNKNDSSLRLSQNSFEDYSYNLKLMRFGVMEQYETTWHTKLSTALKDLIEDCTTSGKVLVLTKRNEYDPLPLDGTPHSLNLDSGTILNAIAVLPHQQQAQQQRQPKPCAEQPNLSSKPKTPRDPNVIHLKLQDGQRKHLKEYPINLREAIGKLRKAYAEDFGHNLEDMKLLNEGDPCSDSDTPLDLELEDGYMLDVVISH